MKTIKLFENDAYADEFEAQVLQTVKVNQSTGVILDRTLFYPASGGQIHDTGIIENIPVIDVIEAEEIIHVLDGAAPSGMIRAKIDRARRFDHMQQHTGQHILSQAFHRILDARTLSFHMSADVSTIDLAVSGLDWEKVRVIEQEANRIVFDNLKVTAHDTASDRIGQFPLRKPPVVEGKIRIMEIDGYEFSACCGTHVKNTGEIGLIKIVKFEKYKEGSRVSFVCGGRALKTLQVKTELIDNISRILTAGEQDILQGIENLKSQIGINKKQAAETEKRLLQFEANEMISQSIRSGDTIYISAEFENRDPKSIASLGRSITDKHKGVCLFAVFNERPAMLIVQSDNGPLDMKDFSKQAMDLLNGKGGGNERQIQITAQSRNTFQAAFSALNDKIRLALSL